MIKSFKSSSKSSFLYFLLALICPLRLSYCIHREIREEALRSHNTQVIGDSRIIIDDAVTERELAALMKIVNSEYTLSKQKNLTSFSDLGTPYKATVVNLPPLVAKKVRSNSHNPYSKKNNPVDSKSHFSLQKDSEIELMSLMMRIVDYAEAFFNKTIFMKSAALFARRKIIIEKRYGEMSSASLNHAAGWLVPIHTDACNFLVDKWTCDPHPSPEEIKTDYGKDISVVLFLNDLSDDGGGEFVFIDRTEKNRKSKSSISSDRSLISLQPKSEIQPPPRHSIRRALSRQSHSAAVTKSVSVTSE